MYSGSFPAGKCFKRYKLVCLPKRATRFKANTPILTTNENAMRRSPKFAPKIFQIRNDEKKV